MFLIEGEKPFLVHLWLFQKVKSDLASYSTLLVLLCFVESLHGHDNHPVKSFEHRKNAQRKNRDEKKEEEDGVLSYKLNITDKQTRQKYSF